MKKTFTSIITIMAIAVMAMTPHSVWADDYVASVTIGSTTTPFSDISQAVTAVNVQGQTSTLKLLADISEQGGYPNFDGVFRFTQGNITLNLNGHNITSPGKDYAVKVAGANVTINDDTETPGTLSCAYTALEYNSGKLTINAGNFIGRKTEGYTGIALYAKTDDTSAKGCIVLNGGYFERGNNYYAFQVSYDKDEKPNWAIIDYSGHYFEDTNGSPVALNTNDLRSGSAVYVKPIDLDKAATTVTIGKETQYYMTLFDAISKAASCTSTSPATIKLLKDNEEGKNRRIEFTQGAAILDLNGKKITTNYNFHVGGTTDLTITDNSDTQEGAIESNSYAIYYDGEAKLTINAGTFTGVSFGLHAYEGSMTAKSQIVLRGGTFVATGTNQPVAIMAPWHSSPANWGIYDMTGYHLEDKGGNTLAFPEIGNLYAEQASVIADNITFDEDAPMGRFPKFGPVNTYGVTVKRTLSAYKWNTLCLPFSMTAEEVTAAFGSDVQIKKIADITDNEINFADTTAIELEKPYLIKPATTINQFSVEGKKFDETTPLVMNNISNGYLYQSVFFKTTLKPSKGMLVPLYILNNNKFYLVDSNVELKGFRWIINDYSQLTKAKILYTNLDDDQTTSIRNVDTDTNGNTPAYNIAGQRISNNAKGIIIKNGRKYINK